MSKVKLILHMLGKGGISVLQTSIFQCEYFFALVQCVSKVLLFQKFAKADRCSNIIYLHLPSICSLMCLGPSAVMRAWLPQLRHYTPHVVNFVTRMNIPARLN